MTGIPGYDGLVLVLDDSRIAVDRTELDLQDGMLSVTSIDWGQAAINAALSQQGKFGNGVVAWNLPNRTITIGLAIGAVGDTTDSSKTEAELALRNLAMKVALFNNEGGWLCRQRSATAGAAPMYADIAYAELTVPDNWLETLGAESGIVLTLSCRPDFYGDEIELDTLMCSGYCDSVLTASGTPAVVAGDYQARCRLELIDTSGNQQNGLVWGVQSRHYDSAATAELVFAASALAPINGAAVASNAAAYGGSVVKVQPSVAGTWWPFLPLQLAAGSKFTHQGSYRVLARVMSATNVPQLQLSWGNTDSAVQIMNTAVQLPAVGQFCVVDLGVVRIDAPPVGSNAWIGTIAARVVTANDDVQVDIVMLVPLDEAAGSLSALSSSGSSAISSSASPATFASSGSGVAWSAEIDDYKATLVVGSAVTSQLLVCTALGLNIPSGSTIVGLAVSFAKGDYLGHASVEDVLLSLYSAGATTGTNHAQAGYWPTNQQAQFTYGGATDTWGTALTPAIVNAPGFGFALSANVASATTATNLIVNAQAAEVTVYFTLGSVALATDAVVFANQALQLTESGAYRTADGTVYAQASTPLGTLTRLPPSGVENRPVRLFAKPMRGQWTNISAIDKAIDTFAVKPHYRPSYMFRP